MDDEEQIALALSREEWEHDELQNALLASIQAQELQERERQEAQLEALVMAQSMAEQGPPLRAALQRAQPPPTVATLPPPAAPPAVAATQRAEPPPPARVFEESPAVARERAAAAALARQRTNQGGPPVANRPRPVVLGSIGPAPVVHKARPSAPVVDSIGPAPVATNNAGPSALAVDSIGPAHRVGPPHVVDSIGPAPVASNNAGPSALAVDSIGPAPAAHRAGRPPVALDTIGGPSGSLPAVASPLFKRSILRSQLVLRERIAEGAHGQVFHADYDGAQVAVKVFKLEVDPRSADRLRADVDKECGSLQKVAHHVSIVRVFGVCEDWTDNRAPFLGLVMELLPTSLHSLLGGPSQGRGIGMDSRAAAHLLRGVAAGLSIIHAAGLVHRDLKPANVLLRRRVKPEPAEWDAVVADFGLTRSMLSSHSGSVAGMVGTPGYMAPEILSPEIDDEGNIVSPPITDRADVFSFGVLAWELCHNIPPFEGKALPVLITLAGKKLLSLKFSAPLPDDGWRPIADIAARCMLHNPAERPSTAEVLNQLSRFLDR